ATNLPIPDTPVIIKEAGKYYTTNSNGIIKYEVSKLGHYTIRIVRSGKVEVFQKEITYDGQKFTIFVNEVIEKGGIEVLGEKDKTKLSRYTLGHDEIKRLPGVSGDSLKAIQTLPGVSPGIPIGLGPSSFSNISISGQPYRNSDRGDIVFRGAGTRANQYYFDGFLVSYPFHLGNQSSVFNNNIIKSFDIYSGAYSARYGYATGGIINIEGKDEVKKNSATVNINMFLSDAMVEGKLSDKAYIIAATRKSYPNVTLLKLYPEGIPPNAKYANYEDYQFKTGWEFAPGHKILLASFGARDMQKYTKAVAEFENENYGEKDSRPPIGLDRRFRTDGFRYTFQPNTRIQNTFSISRNHFQEFFEVKIQNPMTAENIFGLENVTTQTIVFAEERLSVELFKNILKVEAGGNYRERGITLKAENISQQNSQFTKVFNDLLDSNPIFRALIDGDKAKSKEVGSFLEFNFEYKGFKLVPGVRSDYYNLAGQREVSPRLSSSYTIDSTKTTFLAGGSIHHNAPPNIEQISSRVGNSNLKMEKAEHLAGGINQEIGDKWLLKIEGFRNIYSNLVVSDNFIQNPFAINDEPRDLIQRTNYVLRNPLVTKSLYYSNSGTGFSEGVEILLKKSKTPTVKGWFGWISYTNSITKRNNHQARYEQSENSKRNLLNSSRKLLAQTKIGTNYINYYDDNNLELIYDNDKTEYYDLDRTHILNMIFGWKINSDWQVGGRFRYATNVPITPITGSNRMNPASTFGLNLYMPEYSKDYNSYRYLPIHQMDIRIDKFFNFEWGYMNMYLEFVNLYGKRNIVSEEFQNTKPYLKNSNPSPTYDTTNSPYIQSPVRGGHLMYLPLINFGLEAKF
ncbi:MAG: TonB-dependent receptor plug domain-containing protein, partial [Leptospiraceae bacterium]|nr:TonB-dependent receptor plug domain-containing protein [Leptospiraceae bacterium]